MDSLFVSIFTFVASVFITVLVSRYYFLRSLKREITPFIQNKSNLFWADRNIRNSLSIEYKGRPVRELQELQFLVANTGDKSITNIIKPLEVFFPSHVELVDAKVYFISPKEREINISVDEGSVSLTINFSIFNKNEYFVLKVFLIGSVDIKDVKFKITSDDLPPELSIKKLNSYNMHELDGNLKNSLSDYTVSNFLWFIVFLSVSFFSYCSYFYLRYGYFYLTREGEILHQFENYIQKGSVLILFILFIISGLISVGMMLVPFIDYISDVAIAKFKKKYLLPKSLAKIYYGSDVD